MLRRLGLVVLISTALLLSGWTGTVYASSPKVELANFDWVNVLSDPLYADPLEGCGYGGYTTTWIEGTSTWCIKDWNCPERGLCEVTTNEPSMTIRNSKTIDKSGEKTIAYKGVLQGCSASFECSEGFSNMVGLNIPVTKLLEFSSQHPPEVSITVSNLHLTGPSQGILTDLWFIDEEKNVGLVIDIYWKRTPIAFKADELNIIGPVLVLNDTLGGIKVYHYWDVANCLENSMEYQSCTLNLSELLERARNATYWVAKCIPNVQDLRHVAQCVTIDQVGGTADLDYSRLVLQEVDVGLELLFSPYGEAVTTITYSQLRYWTNLEQIPPETDTTSVPEAKKELFKPPITVSTDESTYKESEIVRGKVEVSQVEKDSSVMITLLNPKTVIYKTASISLDPTGLARFHFEIFGEDALPGLWTIRVSYRGYSAITTFIVAATPDTETDDIMQLESGKVNVIDGSTFTTMPYKIANGDLRAVSVYKEAATLIISINPDRGGWLEITLPRELIDARSNARDIPFKVLLDGAKFIFSEVQSTESTRTLNIRFVAGISEIQITGTQMLATEPKIDIQIVAKQIRDIVLVRVRNIAGSTESVSKFTFTLPDSTLNAYKGPKAWEKMSFIENAVTFVTSLDPIDPGEKALFLIKVDRKKPLIIWELYDERNSLLDKGSLKPFVFDQ